MITLEDYETRDPNNNQEYFSKLTTIQKKEYLKLYQKYYKLVLNYVLKKTALASYDETLENNNDRFVQAQKEEMDIYQYLASDKLKYFYLRNNFYIERLEPFELKFLSEDRPEEKQDMFIERTLRRVIAEFPYKDKTLKICFGPDSLKFFKPNGSLIIGVRYNEYSDKNSKDEDWLENHNYTKEELEMLAEAFLNAYPDINGIPIEFGFYNEYTVSSLNKKEEKINDENGNKTTSNTHTKHKKDIENSGVEFF